MQLSNFGEQNCNIQWAILRRPYYFIMEKRSRKTMKLKKLLKKLLRKVNQPGTRR